MSNFMSALKSMAPKPDFATPAKKQEDAGNKAERELAKAQASPARAEPFYLDVPFLERHEAKRLGAWWDPSLKQWFVPAGRDIRPFRDWFPNGLIPQEASPAPSPAPSPDNHAIVSTVSGLRGAPFVPDFETYRRQVDELMQALEMSAADLALFAIDYLYQANCRLRIQG